MVTRRYVKENIKDTWKLLRGGKDWKDIDITDCFECMEIKDKK